MSGIRIMAGTARLALGGASGVADSWKRRRGKGRRGVRGGLGWVLVGLGLASTAGAFEERIPTRAFVARPEGGLVKLVAKAPPGSSFPLPGENPADGTATLRVFDTFGLGGDDTYDLSEGDWLPLGNPPGSKGYRYRGEGSAEDPCRVVLLRKTGIKAVCKDNEDGGMTVAPPFAGAAGVILTIGEDTYCAEAGGREVRNDEDLVKRKRAPAPTVCPSVSSAEIQNPILFVSQTPSDAGEMQINDIHGNFVGDNPERDQPVGGTLLRLDPGSSEPVDLLGLPDVAVRNPEVSWDGRRVIFSMKTGPLGNWQIYEMGVDGTDLTQIGNTPFNETEPVYLPDGRIVFASDRLGMLDAYENFPTGQLFVMDADGSNAELLTADPGGDMTPTVTEEGEIAFVRWQATIKDPCRAQAEPIDFSDLDVSRFFLWVMRPDGDSDAHPVYGAHIIEDFRGGFVQSRPLRDGTGRYLTTIATAETWGAGGIAIIDPTDDVLEAGHPQPEWITDPSDYLDTEDVPASGGRYRDPYPLASGEIVASFGAGDLVNNSFAGLGEPVPDFGLYVLAADGSTRALLYDDPNMWEIEPVEVAARPTPPVLEPTLDLEQASGILNTMDVVLRAQIPGDPPSQDLQGPADDPAWVYLFKGVPSQFVYPPFQGYRQIQPALIGRAPVFPDGSFAAEIPANEPILWKLIDGGGNVLVEERFWNMVRPSQVVTCTGCHSPHDGASARTTNDALEAPTNLAQFDPSRLIPGTPTNVASRAQWHTDQPRELDSFGIPVPKLFAVDDEPRSDRDQISGQATFEVGISLNVDDPRLFGPLASTVTDVAEVRLVRPSVLNPANAQELAEANALADAIQALGPTVTENGTTLRAGSAVTQHLSTPLLSFVVPTDSTRQLQLVAVDSGGVETTATVDLIVETALPPRPVGEEREDPDYAENGAYDVQGGCDPIPGFVRGEEDDEDLEEGDPDEDDADFDEDEDEDEDDEPEVGDFEDDEDPGGHDD